MGVCVYGCIVDGVMGKSLSFSFSSPPSMPFFFFFGMGGS